MFSISSSLFEIMTKYLDILFKKIIQQWLNLFFLKILILILNPNLNFNFLIKLTLNATINMEKCNKETCSHNFSTYVQNCKLLNPNCSFCFLWESSSGGWGVWKEKFWFVEGRQTCYHPHNCPHKPHRKTWPGKP